MRVVARVLAPAPSRSVASGLSPFIAAQWSAVMPSPCAVFTSAPLLEQRHHRRGVAALGGIGHRHVPRGQHRRAKDDGEDS